MSRKYLFDANVFINMQRQYPMDRFPALWREIDELITNGTVLSSQEVFEEISAGDELHEWMKKHRTSFLPTSEDVQNDARIILEEFRGLVEGGKKRNNADPFIIAIAKELDFVIVSEEVSSGNLEAPKIPDVCKELNIGCYKFMDFLREVDIVIG